MEKMFAGINDNQEINKTNTEVPEGDISAFYRNLKDKNNTEMSETIKTIKTKISEVKSLNSCKVNVTYDDIVRGDNKKEYREILKKQMGGLSYFFKFILGFGNKDAIVEIVNRTLEAKHILHQKMQDKCFLENISSHLYDIKIYILFLKGDHANNSKNTSDESKTLREIELLNKVCETLVSIKKITENHKNDISGKYINKFEKFTEGVPSSYEDTNEADNGIYERIEELKGNEWLKYNVNELIKFCNGEINKISLEALSTFNVSQINM
jgi:hypothetical protein